jgi:hypothetical protein
MSPTMLVLEFAVAFAEPASVGETIPRERTE